MLFYLVRVDTNSKLTTKTSLYAPMDLNNLIPFINSFIAINLGKVSFEEIKKEN